MDLEDYLDNIEKEASQEERKYYGLCVSEEGYQLNGLFISAKTSQGAILKLYRYLKKHQDKNYHGERITSLIDLLDIPSGTIYDREEFNKICEEWLTNNTITFKQLIIIDGDDKTC